MAVGPIETMVPGFLVAVGPIETMLLGLPGQGVSGIVVWLWAL